MIYKNQIKECLNQHQKKYPGVKIVKVTTTRYYEVPSSNSQDLPDLMKEWFEKFPVTLSHAFRDSSLLIHHFNDDAQIVDP